MKLYTSLGTNPQIVQHVLNYKGIKLEQVWVDIGKAENRTPDFLTKNPLGQLPVLELDSGQCISQVTAIGEYLEELFPEPPLIGTSPEQRAETRMWLRRNDLLIAEPLVQVFKYSIGLSYYQPLMHCMPDATKDLLIIAQQNIAELNRQMEGHSWICGERFSLADIYLYCILELASNNHQINNVANLHVLSWFDRVRLRLAVDANTSGPRHSN